MANTYKVLGQNAPAAMTNSDLYTVPAGNQAVCSTLALCNLGNSASIRVAVRPGGATLANQHYIVYDLGLVSSDSIFLTLGISLNAGDVVTVYSSTDTTSFSLFGTEVS
jgi:hypothetical protein